jgi:hypothetical protein
MIEVTDLKNGCYCSFLIEGQSFTVETLRDAASVLNYIGWRHFAALADVLKAVLSDSEMANLHQYKERVQSSWRWKSLDEVKKKQSEWEHQQSILREKQAADRLAWEKECKEKEAAKLQEKEKSGGIPLSLNPETTTVLLACLNASLG